MTIGQRIKNRRIELNLSVDEVANKLGKNRATIYRYEKDDIKDLPITVLEPLAKVLETTPADLMGWDIETHSNEYTHFTNLSASYFKGIMNWSEEKGISEAQTAAIRNHFSELLFRYKQLLENYFHTNLNWKREKDSYLNFYSHGRNKKSQKEIEELFIEQDLEKQLKQLETWISTFPRILAEANNDTKCSNTELAAAHERTDIKITDEMRKHDDDIMDDDNF